MVRLTAKGDFRKVNSFFEKIREPYHLGELDKYGRQGVRALKAVTPVDSGKTAHSWDYTIERKDGEVTIYWTNSNLNEGVNIAVVLQYGHATGNGYFVKGVDYINPAMAPVFDNIAESAWKEVVD